MLVVTELNRESAMPSNRFFDSHCHFDFEQFEGVRDSIWQHCVEKGVARLLIPGVTADSWSRIVELCRGKSEWNYALGLHPCFMGDHEAAHLALLEASLRDFMPVAIGEIGLDYWDKQADVEGQLLLFKQQLSLAKDFDLPVILHVRKAHDQVLKWLRHYQLERAGVVHAFSGSEQQANQYIQLGFKLGIGGAITYPRAKRLQRIVAALPIEALVLETDAPDMPLSGHQGAINRPDRVVEVFNALSKLRQESAERLEKQLWSNTVNLFSSRL